MDDALIVHCPQCGVARRLDWLFMGRLGGSGLEVFCTRCRDFTLTLEPQTLFERMQRWAQAWQAVLDGGAGPHEDVERSL